MGKSKGNLQRTLVREVRRKRKVKVDLLEYGDKYCPRCNDHSVNIVWLRHPSGQRVARHALLDGKVVRVRLASAKCWKCQDTQMAGMLPGETLIDLYSLWFDRVDKETRFSWFVRTSMWM